MAVNEFSNSNKKMMQLSVVSLEKSFFIGKVAYVAATGMIGEMGIYPGHLQLLTKLKPGQVRFEQENGQEEIIYISGGILEVQPDEVTVLTDTAMRAEDIDEVAAEEAKARAEASLSQKGIKRQQIDYHQALVEIAEATAKLRAIQQLRKGKN